MTVVQEQKKEVWASGNLYEPYVGRWSRLVAHELLNWLEVPLQRRWLDVGCGTGVLSEVIFQTMDPLEVRGIDQSEGYIAFAREKIQDERARFETGDAEALPVSGDAYDAIVSGLCLNFVPHPEQAVLEMTRVAKPGGVIALYVWDYAGKMQMMRHFWNAAAALDPAASQLDEGRRFLICNPNSLAVLFKNVGLRNVETRPIDVDAHFKDFDDYWSPLHGGQAPAPGYAMSLSEERRAALRERIRDSLPFAIDGSIPLVARAWAVRGWR
jgi:SAM-dependent methyltransferase